MALRWVGSLGMPGVVCAHMDVIEFIERDSDGTELMLLCYGPCSRISWLTLKDISMTKLGLTYCPSACVLKHPKPFPQMLYSLAVRLVSCRAENLAFSRENRDCLCISSTISKCPLARTLSRSNLVILLLNFVL